MSSAMRRAALMALVGLAVLLPAAAASAQDEPQSPPPLLPFDIPGLENVFFDDATQNAEDGSFTLSGYVDVDGGTQFRLQADEVTITPPADPDAEGADYYFVATGNVAFEAGEISLLGSRMSGYLRSGTGEIENAFGIGPGGVYFRGDSIAQVEPGVYHVEKGVVTPCTQTLPIWEFSASSFDLFTDDHVTMKVPIFKVKGVPLMVLPALYWPIQEDRRSSGLLLPSIGTDSRKGFTYIQPAFWAINRSMDATFTYNYYSKIRSGFGAEYRHRATESSVGNARFFWLQGSNFTEDEVAAGAQPVPGGWTLDGAHLHSLSRGWRVNANANFFSSKEFIQSFEDNFNNFLRRNSSVGVFLTRSWDSYNFSVVGDHNETYFGNTSSVVRRRLPEVEFRVRRRPIVEPLYVTFEGSYAGLLREERNIGVDTRGGRYQRLDAFPEVSLAFSQIPWLTFNPFLAWRSTYYSQRYADIGGDFEADPILRNVYETGFQVIGPSIFRIFDTPTSEYSPRYKHVLEPRFTWGKQNQLEHLDFTNNQIIQFDEIDRFGGERHFARFSLTNRLLAKRFNNPNDEQRGVWEVFSVELARDFDLREAGENQVLPRIPLPWSLGGRFTPTPPINIAGSIRFTRDWQPAGFALTGSMRAQAGFANVTWFRSAQVFPDEDDPSLIDLMSTDRLTGGGRVNLFRDLVTVNGNLTWDVSQGLLQAYMIGATWNTQCCSIGGQLAQNQFSFRDDIQFSLLVELLNVGSLGFGNENR